MKGEIRRNKKGKWRVEIEEGHNLLVHIYRETFKKYVTGMSMTPLGLLISLHTVRLWKTYDKNPKR